MRYLGNKTRLLETLALFIEKNQIEGESFCDLFAGSASVGDYFKDKYKIIANDFLYSSYVIAQGRINNGGVPAFKTFKSKFGCGIFDYFNNKTYEKEQGHFVWEQYSPKGGRMFFTEIVANKIDGIRLELEDLYKNQVLDNNEYFFMLASLLETAMGYSNTTGTYEAFLKIWDSRALREFILEPLTIQEKEPVGSNVIYCTDANELIREISGDILYLDTPYTITEYSSAYHLLETIAKYDNPEIRGLTGRRVQNVQRSHYSKKEKVLFAYEDLIRQAKFKDIIISYSTQGLVPVEELCAMLKKYAVNGKLTIEKIPFREYKNIRTSNKGDNLCEVIIHLKKEQTVLKSPLNYSGSKNYIVDKIIENLPHRVTTFIDAMGGAFNVGANIVATDKVVYNEYIGYVYEIVKLIIESDKEELCEKVQRVVEQYGLEKCNKETYLAFREAYNKEQTPLGLFVLQMFCFQNQLRFNSQHKFNTPIGNCGCNETTYERIRAFKPRTDVVELMNVSFTEIVPEKYDKDALFYFDPPYFITNATYNDGKRGFNGWDADQEVELLAYLSELNRKGYKFLLSNVIHHKGKTNNLLQEWINSNQFNVVQVTGGARQEVLIRNY